MASSSSQYCSTSLPDVGAVARADERREAQAAVGDLLEDRRAEGAGLAEEPGAPAGGMWLDSDAFSWTAGSVLMMPRQLGPISRRP